jgi:hypothetical protein
MTAQLMSRERLEEIASDPMINQCSEFAMMARMAHPSVDFITLDNVLQKHERRRCKDRNCNKPIYGYSVDGLCEDCYAAVSQKPAPVVSDVSPLVSELPAPVVPVVPDDVLNALQDVARIRADLNNLDGDCRGVGSCLWEAEERLLEIVAQRSAMLSGGKS